MPIKSLPVIHDGRMFVGNDNTGFYCYDVENGDLLWNIESTLPSLKGTVCVAKFLDENVFYTSYDGTVRSVNYKTGNHNWTVKADLNLHSAVEIDAENRRLFLGTEWDKRDPWYGRGDIICLNADTGRELWRTPTRGMIPASPYFSKKHNKVFCGSNDFHVYILNADTGEIVATVPTMGEVKGKIAATENEDIFVAQSITGNVHAFTVTGEILWTRNIGYDSLHPYPLVWGDSVYAANNGAHILSLDINTGTVNWLCKIRSSVGWGVTKIGEHLLAVGTNGYVAVIDRHTGEKLAIDEIYRTATVNGAVCHQPAAYDGKNLIIVTNNKGILAYKLDINDYDFN
jgi:outer membrane protein assembly factor BamB